MSAKNFTTGVGLIEVVVAISVIATVLGLAVGIAALSLHIETKAKINIQLTLLAEAGIEGVRVVRLHMPKISPAKDFFSLTDMPEGSYCLNLSGVNMTLQSANCTGVTMPTGFSRSIVIAKAATSNCDENEVCNILSEDEGNESEVRKVMVTVTAPDGSSKTLTTVLAKIEQ